MGGWQDSPGSSLAVHCIHGCMGRGGSLAYLAVRNFLSQTPTPTIIESCVELPIAVNTWVCAGEVLAVEEREKGLAGREEQQWGEALAS